MNVERVALCLVLAVTSIEGIDVLASDTNSTPVTVIDLLVDPEQYVDKMVTFECSKFYAADRHSVWCKYRDQNISLSSDSMKKDSLRKALTECGGFMTPPTCAGTVTGTLRISMFNMLSITNASIVFK
jgi:hypothetical protein